MRGGDKPAWGRRAFWIVPILLAAACSGPGDGDGVDPDDDPARSDYVETGDLPDLRARGRLRVLVPPRTVETLPRRVFSVDHDLELATAFAEGTGLELEVIPVSGRQDLLDALEDGRGDLALGRLTATADRRRRFTFTVAVDHVRETVVVRRGRDDIRAPEDLAGLRVAVRPGSSFHGTLTALAERIPAIVVVPVADDVGTEELLYRLASDGAFDATIADDDMAREAEGYLPLRAAFAVSPPRPIGWAMRAGSVELKSALDEFLHSQAMTRGVGTVALGDLDAIRERGVLRVLTRNNAATYFLYRGRQMGFEFELASAFADSIGCRVQIVVPPSADLLIPWLLEGRGDLIAANLTDTPERALEVTFTRPYNRVSEMVVVHRDDDSVQVLADLAGRTVAVRGSSSYYETLTALRDRTGVLVVRIAEDLETEELIAQVAEGRIGITVADSNILDIELSQRSDVRSAFPLGEPRKIAWAVRPADEDLLDAANRFLAREYRGTFHNVLRKKYFSRSPRVAWVQRSRPARQGRLSPYDDLFRRYGREVEIDWRLLVAQAYQESRFDPAAISWAGAEGLMQIMPGTAAELGVEGDLRDPEVGVRAGARYLRRLIDRFDPSLEYHERLRFALAAYNAGLGHVEDGRRLARENDRDPNVWFGHVEAVLPLLGKSAYASNARYGYCRCEEPLQYVRQINDRYIAYTRVVR